MQFDGLIQLSYVPADLEVLNMNFIYKKKKILRVR